MIILISLSPVLTAKHLNPIEKQQVLFLNKLPVNLRSLSFSVVCIFMATPAQHQQEQQQRPVKTREWNLSIQTAPLDSTRPVATANHPQSPRSTQYNSIWKLLVTIIKDTVAIVASSRSSGGPFIQFPLFYLNYCRWERWRRGESFLFSYCSSSFFLHYYYSQSPSIVFNPFNYFLLFSYDCLDLLFFIIIVLFLFYCK